MEESFLGVKRSALMMGGELSIVKGSALEEVLKDWPKTEGTHGLLRKKGITVMPIKPA